MQILWALCVYVEAVSVLPQLRMMQKAKVLVVSLFKYYSRGSLALTAQQY